MKNSNIVFTTYPSSFNYIFLFFACLGDSSEAFREGLEPLLPQYDVASCAFS